MTLLGALACTCLGLTLFGAVCVFIRSLTSAYWWDRYCATVGGEKNARMVVLEREKKLEARVDELMRVGMREVYTPSNVIRIVDRISRRPVKFTNDGDSAA